MKKKITKAKIIIWSAIAIGLLGLVAMDMAFTSTQTVIPGTFRADSLFAFPQAPATSVAVIASDNTSLTSPTPVTNTNLTFAQVKDMVKHAIDLVGGISKYVKAGDTVLIKPNLVSAKLSGDGETTDIRVVKAIVRIIYDTYGNGCTIYVGDGSAKNISSMGGSLFKNCGYQALFTDTDLTGVNFQLIDLDDEVAAGANIIKVKTKASLAEPHGGYYWIHKYLVSPNIKYIDVPVLKMHEPGLTCCLKNQIGIAAGWAYGWNKLQGGTKDVMIHHNNFNAAHNYTSWQDEELTDLSSCIDHFDLCVVDALMCLEYQKTLMSGNSNQVRLNTIIAGPDPVAVDHVCCHIIGTNPDDICHITMAAKIGLGTNNHDSITVLGENLSRYTHQFTRGSIHSQYGQGNRVWLLSTAFPGSDINTQYIANEATLAPSKGDAGWSPPYYFFDDRIDLLSFYNPSGSVVSYAYTNVYSPTAKSASLWMNCEEATKVYLNGTLVYNPASPSANTNIVSDTVVVNLLAGENTLLVKTLQTTGNYDFSLNICEKQTLGNRVDGLKFYIKNYNVPAVLNPAPTLSTPANKTQGIALGSPIANIVYTWGGGATDVTVTGLPAGVIATKNPAAQTVTISGTPTAAASTTYTVTTVGGTGAPVVVSGSIRAYICSSLAQLTISSLASTGIYRLALFDAPGTTELKTLANGTFTAGNTNFLFNKSTLASGTYTWKLLTGVTVVKSGTVVIP